MGVTPAMKAARELGVPDGLFVGLCEWLEDRPVDSPNPSLRYAPNTRARALQFCKTLVSLRGLL